MQLAELLARHSLSLFHQMDEAVVIIDRKGDIAAWNPAAEKLLGLTGPEAVGRQAAEIVDLDKNLGHHKDGTVVQLRINRISSGVSETILLLTPIHALLEETEEELRSIRYALDQSSIVAITDRQGVIEYVNDKFTQISQYSRNELIGKTHRVINSKYHPKAYIQKLWETIMAGKIWRGELRNQAKDGSYYWVDTTITPLLGKDGKPKKFIAIRNDITRRKALEQQKDEFMAIASHELKTPITSLKGYFQLFSRLVTKTNDSKLLTLVEKMDRQIAKLIVLINDLLDVTRIEAGKLQFHEEELDLNQLVEEITADVQLTAAHHTIRKKLDKPVFVKGDRERLGQVLTNLLTNAIKYSPEADDVWVSTQVTNEEARVYVQDSGIGIRQSEIEHLFQKFYRSDTVSARNAIPGIGLGLYITAEIVKRHQGKIWADSQEGKGSTFGFSLPVAA